MAEVGRQSLEAFLAALASKAPTPGGGGAAALAGALAAALGAMCGNLTLGKAKFAAVEGEVAPLVARAEGLSQDFLGLIEADAAAFAGFMAVYKLPKGTEEERARRQQASRQAAVAAAQVPLEIAAKARDCACIAQRMAVLGNPQLLSDAVCAALLARAALGCARLNVEVNLPFTGDQQLNASLTAQLERLEGELEEAVAATLARWQQA